MNRRFLIPLKWTIYSALFLFVLLFSSVVLGDKTFFGAKLSLLPVYITCVACREGHESGGFFALITTFFWALSGASGVAVILVMLTLSCVIAGYICSAYLTRSLLPTAVFCLMSLVLSEGGVYAQRIFMGEPMPSNALLVLGITVGLSVLSAPLFWLLTRAIGKVGR